MIQRILLDVERNQQSSTSDSPSDHRITGTRSAMLNFMCQVGEVIVPRYLVKHPSMCFCKGIVKGQVNI